MIRTFTLSPEWREFGDLSDLLNSFRKLCETKLDYPGLARPLAFGAEGKVPYVAYTNLAGTAMDAMMRQDGPRPVAEVLQRATQLADAIDFAASAGVYHGMLAPCDVFLEREWTGVTGFGLAQALIKVGIPAETESRYGSPQRLAGAPPTRADDIYSLAAITLELLIGTPADPEQDMSPALREAQGLPERRRLPRPAAHETRLFTSIAGVDAGKLRACFAAAFSEEPSERPATASDFVASFQDAIANKREMDEPAPSVKAVAVVRDTHDERKEPPSAAVLDTKRTDDAATLDPPTRVEPVVEKKPEPVVAKKQEPVVAKKPEPVVAKKQETLAMSEPLIREYEPELPERKPEDRVPRPETIGRSLFADIAPLRVGSIDEASYGASAQSASSRALVGAVVAVVSLAAGFGGGFIVGQHSRPSTESTTVSQHEPVAQPQPARTTVDDPKSIASPPQTVAPTAEEKITSPEPIAAPVASQPAPPADESGRLIVRSTPAGADVMVDGQSRGVTPLTLRELPFGAHTIAVSHAGHDTRQQRVTLSERRPSRSIDFELHPTSTAGPETTATDSTTSTRSAPSGQAGSLQVASHPAGAQVFVDDNLIGTTPLLIPNVAAGSRRLRIDLSGYKAWTKSVQIEPSERSRVSVSLEP